MNDATLPRRLMERRQECGGHSSAAVHRSAASSSAADERGRRLMSCLSTATPTLLPWPLLPANGTLEGAPRRWRHLPGRSDAAAGLTCPPSDRGPSVSGPAGVALIRHVRTKWTWHMTSGALFFHAPLTRDRCNLTLRWASSGTSGAARLSTQSTRRTLQNVVHKRLFQ